MEIRTCPNCEWKRIFINGETVGELACPSYTTRYTPRMRNDPITFNEIDPHTCTVCQGNAIDTIRYTDRNPVTKEEKTIRVPGLQVTLQGEKSQPPIETPVATNEQEAVPVS